MTGKMRNQQDLNHKVWKGLAITNVPSLEETKETFQVFSHPLFPFLLFLDPVCTALRAPNQNV